MRLPKVRILRLRSRVGEERRVGLARFGRLWYPALRGGGEGSLKRAVIRDSVDDLLFYTGKVAERLAVIGALAGISGNLSLRVDQFPLDEFPEAGKREQSLHAVARPFPELLGRRFLITGSGKNLRYIAQRPHTCLALIEIVDAGYRILWGMRPGELITSEHPAHLLTYARRPAASAIIHAQPTSVNVFTRLFRGEDSMNRLLSVQHEQLANFSPRGIGLVEAMRHGSFELGEAVSSSLAEKEFCAVVRHGTFAVGEGQPVDALNLACDLQEYYHDAARTFLDNPWLRLLPIEFVVKNLDRVARLPLGDRMVNAFLRPPR